MAARAHALLVAAVVFTCKLASGVGQNHERQKRTVMAWATGDPAAAAQLRNATWSGVFDGVQAFCGASFRPDGLGIELDQAQWEKCSPLIGAVRDTGMKFYLVLGNVPSLAVDNPDLVISSAIELATKYDLDGFSLDDEYDCAPRSTLDRFRSWVEFVNKFSRSMHSLGLEVSAAVQAMFGVQDVPYNPNCGPGKTPAECSQACKYPPSQYPLEPEIVDLMSQSEIDRWLEMDTYYFTTARFLNALDWYVEYVANDKLGLAMMNRGDLSEDGLLARFYAIDKSGVDWINIFLLPAHDMFLPYLRRWKTYCAGCGVQSVLGCYDLTVACETVLRESMGYSNKRQEYISQ